MVEYELVDENQGSSHFSEYDEESTEIQYVKRSTRYSCLCQCCIKVMGNISTFCQKFCSDCSGINAEPDENIAVRNNKYAAGVLEGIFALNYCYWFSTIIHNKFCNFLFKCGCTWSWAGGWKDCNVHNLEGPRCPWCLSRSNISWTTDYLLTALMIVTYFYLLSRRKKIIGHPLVRLFAPIFVYFSVGIIVGACFLAGGYPSFIF